MQTIGNHWDTVLHAQLCSPQYAALQRALDVEYRTTQVFPPREHVLRALRLTDYDGVKAVILGQDPYHRMGQANGLAFAVNEGVPLPPSLQNIYREIEDDLGVAMPRAGTLIGWQKQGVLLLNTTLTVRRGQPQSHAGLGWQPFTDAIIAACSAREKPLAFLLWGSGAIAKKPLIARRHLVLTAPHPSPLSAYRGFFGCRHFSRVNDFLRANGETPIDWTDVEGVTAAEYYRRSDTIRRI